MSVGFTFNFFPSSSCFFLFSFHPLAHLLTCIFIIPFHSCVLFVFFVSCGALCYAKIYESMECVLCVRSNLHNNEILIEFSSFVNVYKDCKVLNRKQQGAISSNAFRRFHHQLIRFQIQFPFHSTLCLNLTDRDALSIT